MAKKKAQEDYGASLTEEYARWFHLYENGGQDPFWSDGSNLHLVRNHIIYYKRKIEETMHPEQYPPIYYKDLPPEVPHDYMAKADEIRENAKASLGRYLTDPEYQFLCRRVDTLDPMAIKRLSVIPVIGYATIRPRPMSRMHSIHRNMIWVVRWSHEKT